ncbi:hypothetical protein MTO96_013010 [Rhipicephalus appendiculatus]
MNGGAVPAGGRRRRCRWGSGSAVRGGRDTPTGNGTRSGTRPVSAADEGQANDPLFVYRSISSVLSRAQSFVKTFSETRGSAGDERSPGRTVCPGCEGLGTMKAMFQSVF